MTDDRLALIAFRYRANYETDIDELVAAYRALTADHAALVALVRSALDNVGGLGGAAPELARAVGWEGGGPCP